MIDIGDALAWGPSLPLIRVEGRYLPPVAYSHATDDEATLRRMLAETPRAVGVGVVASAARLLVIDVEHPSKGNGDGPATMRSLQMRFGTLPPTRTHRTKSGGWHLVFEAPDAAIRSSHNMMRYDGIEAPGVDVVAGHAMLRWPPTLGYAIARALPSARLPEPWIYAMGDRPVRVERGGDEPQIRYARVALERVTTDLAAMAETRNVGLNKAAYRLGRMCPPLDTGDVVAALVAACEMNGSWSEHGSRACLGSMKRGLAAGARRPLRLISGDRADALAGKVSLASASDGVVENRGNQDGHVAATGTDRRAQPLDRSPRSPSTAAGK